MNVPLSITYFKNKFRVTHNKKTEILRGIEVPVFDTRTTTDVFDVVGHGRMELGIKLVRSPEEYNTIKGNMPINFFNQLYVTKGNPCCNYKNTNNLDMYYFDIEVLTKGDGKFPKAKERPVICVGTAMNDEDVIVFSDYNMDPEKETSADTKILNDFLDDIYARDPDILIGYYSNSFDMPYIIERCEILRLPWWKLFRIYKIAVEDGQDEKKIIEFIKEYREKNPFNFELLGRLHYDVYKIDVERDQLLTDLKDRKMKTVARHCGFSDVIELEKDEITDTQKLMMEDPDRLIEYQKSDVRQTRSISKRYFAQNVALAEELNVPLETMISRSDGTPATLYLLREMYKSNYFVVDTNADRYKQLYFLNPKFQGAINGIYKKGYFPKLHKYDFSNMYPSSMWTWNLGPDTTVIDKLTDYTGEYRFSRTDKILKLEIPDSNYNRQVHITVNMENDSFTKEAIEKLWKMRSEYKETMKSSRKNSKAYNKADTSQGAIKVILNSVLPDTPIMYADKLGIHFEKIENINDRTIVLCSNNNGLSEGGLSDKVWSFDVKDKPMLEVKTINGRSVHISEDHSIMKLVNNNVIDIAGSKLKEGDELLSIRKSQFTTIVPELNLLRDEKFIDYIISQSDSLYITFGKNTLSKRYLTRKKDFRLKLVKLLKSSHIKRSDKNKSTIDKLMKDNLLTVSIGNKWLDGRKYTHKLYTPTSDAMEIGNFIEEYNSVIETHKISRSYLLKVNSSSISKYFRIIILLGGMLKVGRSGRSQDPIINISKDFGYFLGAYCAEGSGGKLPEPPYKNSYRGIISQKTGPVDMEKCKSAYDKAFATTSTITKSGLTFNSGIVILFLQYYTGKYHNFKKVPPFVFMQENAVIKEFIRGEFEGDGNRIKSRSNRTICYRFSTTSPSLANGLMYLAHMIDMNTIIAKDKDDMFRLKIYGDLYNDYATTSSKQWKKLIDNRFRTFNDFSIDTVKSIRKYKHTGKLYDISVPHLQNFTGGIGNLLLHNSLYGLQGTTHSIGDLAIAIAVTGMCRWTTKYVKELMGDNCCAIDTDGIVTDSKFDSDFINLEIKNKIREQMGIENSRMLIEDEWESRQVKGFLYRMKNYVLEEDGEIIKHGVAMKSSQKPKVYDRAIDIVIDHIFKDKMTKQEVMDKVKDIKDLDIEYFVMKTKLSKNVDEYMNQSGTNIFSKIIQQIKEHKDIVVGKKDIIEYVHCINPVTGISEPIIPELVNRNNIDWAKYNKFLDDMLKIFDMEEDANISDFGNMFSLVTDDNKSIDDDLSFFT